MMKSLVLFTLVIYCQISVYAQCDALETLNLKKTALIFGEKNYQYCNVLKNTANDAQDVGDSLNKIGFDVFVYYDRNLNEMNAAVDQWCSKLHSYNVAFFYFAGHGAELNGENYLFPIDAHPKTPNEMSLQCFSANNLLTRIENSNIRFNIMILDACRSNIFAKSWTRGEVKTGLASMVGKGSYIAYAAAPGASAEDGKNRNGTYTEGILKYLTTPNLPIDQIFTQVNSYVRNATGESQIPYTSSSLSSQFCFTGKRVSTNSEKKSFLLRQPPSEVLLSNDQSFLINSTDSGIAIKDALSLINFQEMTLENKKPFQILSITDHTILALDSIDRKLFVIDIARKALIASVKLEFKPTCMTVARSSNTVYVGFDRGKVGGYFSIDLNQNSLKKVTELTFIPIQIELSFDDKILYSLSSDSLYKSFISNEKIVSKRGGFTLGRSLGVSPDNKIILVGNVTNGVPGISFFNASTLKLNKQLDRSANLFVFTPDSSKVLAMNSKDLSVIDLKNIEFTNKMSFSEELRGVAVSYDGVANIWFPNEKKYFVKRIDELTSFKEMDLDSKINQFREATKNAYVDEMKSQAEMKRLFDTVSSTYEATVKELCSQFGPQYSVTKRGGLRALHPEDTIFAKYNAQLYGETFGIFAFNNHRSIDTHYVIKFLPDNMYILYVYEIPNIGHGPEIYRATRNKIDLAKLKDFIRKYFGSRLEQLNPY